MGAGDGEAPCWSEKRREREREGRKRVKKFRFWSFDVERIRELIITIRLDRDEGLGFDLGFIFFKMDG